MNDDEEAQQRIINNLLLPYATGDFHPDYLHEHAGGRLSAFLKRMGYGFALLGVRVHGVVVPLLSYARMSERKPLSTLRVLAPISSRQQSVAMAPPFAPNW